MQTFTDSERDSMSRAFDAGNYASAYESNDLETALEAFNEETDDDCEACLDGDRHAHRSDHERAAFVLGFYSSHALHEIPAGMRDEFDAAYFSDAGQYMVKVARYCDDRTDEYAAENEDR